MYTVFQIDSYYSIRNMATGKTGPLMYVDIADAVAACRVANRGHKNHAMDYFPRCHGSGRAVYRFR